MKILTNYLFLCFWCYFFFCPKTIINTVQKTPIKKITWNIHHVHKFIINIQLTVALYFILAHKNKITKINKTIWKWIRFIYYREYIIIIQCHITIYSLFSDIKCRHIFTGHMVIEIQILNKYSVFDEFYNLIETDIKWFLFYYYDSLFFVLMMMTCRMILNIR